MVVESFGAEKERIAIRVMAPGTVPQSVVEPILWGLEEEGIPAEVQRTDNAPATHLAKRAADGSPLGVGIGINVIDLMVTLHHRDLPEDGPLFSLAAEDMNPTSLRLLGANAARLFKGDPFVFQDEPMTDRKTPDEDDSPNHGLERVVASVLEEMLRAQDKR